MDFTVICHSVTTYGVPCKNWFCFKHNTVKANCIWESMCWLYTNVFFMFIEGTAALGLISVKSTRSFQTEFPIRSWARHQQWFWEMLIPWLLYTYMTLLSSPFLLLIIRTCISVSLPPCSRPTSVTNEECHLFIYSLMQ